MDKFEWAKILPMKHSLQQKADGSWGFTETPKVILPALVNLQYIDDILGGNARLYKNQIDCVDGDIWNTQPFRRYYICWVRETELNEMIMDKAINKEAWVLEDEEGYEVIGYVPKEIDPVRLLVIGAVYLEEGYPEEYQWHTRYMKESHKRKYASQSGYDE